MTELRKVVNMERDVPQSFVRKDVQIDVQLDVFIAFLFIGWYTTYKNKPIIVSEISFGRRTDSLSLLVCDVIVVEDRDDGGDCLGLFVVDGSGLALMPCLLRPSLS